MESPRTLNLSKAILSSSSTQFLWQVWRGNRFSWFCISPFSPAFFLLSLLISSEMDKEGEDRTAEHGKSSL